MSRRKQLENNYKDEDKIKCQICNKLFIQITGKHLLSHDITPDEYKIKFSVESLISPAAQKKKMASIIETEKTLIRHAWNRGIARTEEEKLIQSKTMKKKYESGDIIHWNKGNVWSDEVKDKISNSLKGHKFFDEDAITKRNETIQRKIENGWISPLKDRPISAEHKEKSSKIFIEFNENRKRIALESIKRKCQLNNVSLIDIENNYYLKLQCNVCSNIFHNTRQVFNESKNNGIELCPQCFPKNIIVSNAEIELRDFFKTILPDEIIIFNDRKELSGKEIDIYFPDKKIGIEFNGLYWHSTDRNEIDYHILHKTQFAWKRGIRLISIFENEWISKKDIITSRLSFILGVTKNKLYARNTKIEIISHEISKQFLDQNHIQGNISGSLNIGLYYENELVSVMTFGKTRYDDSAEYELLRFCNKLNYTVVGGASKLFKYFIKNYNPNSIVSYSDRRWNTGNVYKQIGFEFLHNSKPNYYYIEKNIHHIIFSRYQFQKHKLKDKLNNYDDQLTEIENMCNNGYRRIYDCGNSKWLWSKNDE